MKKHSITFERSQMIMIVGMILQLDFCYICVSFLLYHFVISINTNMIAIDLGKQVELAALKVIQKKRFWIFHKEV